MNDCLQDSKHNELPKERRLPWLALNEVSSLVFLCKYTYIKDRILQVALLYVSQT